MCHILCKVLRTSFLVCLEGTLYPSYKREVGLLRIGYEFESNLLPFKLTSEEGMLCLVLKGVLKGSYTYLYV